MTPLDRALKRVRSLGFESVELRLFPNGWGASLGERDREAIHVAPGPSSTPDLEA